MSAHVVTSQISKEKDQDTLYTTMASVTNNCDSIIKFWVFNCAWPVYNWVVDNDSIHIEFPICNSNFPVQIKLLPRERINFYGGKLLTYKKLITNRYFRMGFIFFKTEKEAWFYFENKISKHRLNICWSDKIKLEKLIYRFEVETKDE